MVAEDDEAATEGGLGRGDAVVQLFERQADVTVGQRLALANVLALVAREHVDVHASSFGRGAAGERRPLRGALASHAMRHELSSVARATRADRGRQAISRRWRLRNRPLRLTLERRAAVSRWPSLWASAW